MDNESAWFNFIQVYWEWIFGSGGVVGLVILVIKIVNSKPTIQQTQSVQGKGEGYQAGENLTVTKKESAK